MVSPLQSLAAQVQPTRFDTPGRLANLRAIGEQTAASQQRRQMLGREEKMQRVQFVNQLAKKLKGTDQTQWNALLTPHLQVLQQMGLDPSELQGLDMATIDGVIAQTDAVLGSQGADQIKVGARKIYSDGTVLQSTPSGPRVFSPSGELLSGEAAQEQVRRANENEIALTGGKAQARGFGSTIGKGEATAKMELPDVLATATGSLDILQKAIDHPGRMTATGASSRLDPRNFTPGTEAYNFNVLMDQIQGRTFLQAYQSLRGGGQITEIEGKKAEQAIARLNTAQSEDEFLNALKDLKDVIESGIARAKKKAGVSEDKSKESQGFDLEYDPATGEFK